LNFVERNISIRNHFCPIAELEDILTAAELLQVESAVIFSAAFLTSGYLALALGADAVNIHARFHESIIRLLLFETRMT